MSVRYYQGPVSDHFDGERFYNPGQATTDKKVKDLLRWRRQARPAVWPEGGGTSGRVVPAAGVAGLAVTMVGHATVLIQVAGRNILVDPMWSERASPVGFAGPRRKRAPGIAFGDLPPIDTVLITHNHYDHLDRATLGRLRDGHGPRVIAPLGNGAVIGGVVEEGDWGDGFTLGPGVRVTLHPAHHWSARGWRDRRMALWCGFVLETDAGVIYVAGDTAYGDGAIFRAIRERFGAPVVAVLPIGAYEPRWFMRTQHVNPAEAVQIMLDCGAGQGLGVHWGTFQLTDEGREAPREALLEACGERGVEAGRFLALEPGDVWAV